MIEEMLTDLADQGADATDIRYAVMQTLQPYFSHIESLNRYALDSQILSAFEFFVRYNHDVEFRQGVSAVLDLYRDAKRKHEAEFWDILLSSFASIVEDENKMWSVRQKKTGLDEEDLYEKTVSLFARIGDSLEISTKHLVQELYAIFVLNEKGTVNYPKIAQLDFGVVINNLLVKGQFSSILMTAPSGLKLSDWRNIAYHHTYSLLGEEITCVYGKSRDSIRLTISDLEYYAYYVIRSSNILNIARCIFVYDCLDEIPRGYPLGQASFRFSIRRNQFEIELLSQQFAIVNVCEGSNNIEIDIKDLLLYSDLRKRLIHCSQLLINTWSVWQKEQVCINYVDRNGKYVCKFSTTGDVCKKIYEGSEPISYLASKVQKEQL